jgi:diguanylate cyclase (GGDEF)-like protein
LRKWDIVSRWGGEEFILILPEITHRVLGKIAERIRLLIEHSFIMVENKKIHVTVSVGATLAQAGDTADSIIKRADNLMYQSKLTGRNKVTKDF